MSASTQVLIARTFSAIAFGGRSASDLLSEIRRQGVDNVAYVQESVYGTARFFFSLNKALALLIEKPISRKNADIQALILTSFYQLKHLSKPDYVVVSEAVEAVSHFRKEWAKPLVNGILRRFLREQEHLYKQIAQNEEARHELPTWLIKRLRNAWRNDFDRIVSQSLGRAPMTLRVNQTHVDFAKADDFLHDANLRFRRHPKALEARILEHATSVDAIPGFATGLFSVQDASAQIAAKILPIKTGQLVVDACAAPGGKSAHLAESSNIRLVALEKDESRAEKIQENLSRLTLSAEVVVTDATKWQSSEPIDALLIDVPCSATGVIRRQPDIKLHRKDTDIYPLVQLQRALLENLWSQLKPNGYLLYATCSLLPDENHKQIKRFCRDHKCAQVVDLPQPLGRQQCITPFGTQVFPDEYQDGFFYCLLQKQ